MSTQFPYPADTPARIHAFSQALRTQHANATDLADRTKNLAQNLADWWEGVASETAQATIAIYAQSIHQGSMELEHAWRAVDVYYAEIVAARNSIDEIREAHRLQQLAGATGPAHSSSFQPVDKSNQAATAVASVDRSTTEYLAVVSRFHDATQACSSALNSTLPHDGHIVAFAMDPTDDPLPEPHDPNVPIPIEPQNVSRSQAWHDELTESWGDVETFMVGEMKKNEQSLRERLIVTNYLPGMREFVFSMYVAPGRAWDHKKVLLDVIRPIPGQRITATDTYLPVPGTNVTLSHDIWSNIHYGYVGKRNGFTEFELNQAQQLPWNGITDEADLISSRIGYELAEKYPPDELTEEVVRQAIIDHLDEYEAAARDATRNSSQFRYESIIAEVQHKPGQQTAV